MSENLNNITSCLKQYLEDFEQRFSLCLNDGKDVGLDAVLGYASQMKGKRIRPILAMLVAGSLGKISEQTMRSSLIVELLHLASLLHDDVLDNSTQRRGKQTINALWGNHIAILVGDYLYGKALSQIQTQEDFNLMPIYAKVAMDLPRGEMSEGESSKNNDLRVETYLSVIYNKTASLIETAVVSGFLTCGNTDFDLEKVHLLGRSLGMAYQIKDDMLDYKDNTGKPCGIDLKEGKITLPLIYYIEQATEQEKQELLSFLFSQQKDNALLQDYVSQISQSPVMQKVEDDLLKHSNQALQIINSLPQNTYSEALRQLAQYLILREK